MDDVKSNSGSLFGSINYPSVEHLELFLSGLTKEQSLYVIIQGLEYSNSRGVFSLQESEILSKSLRILNKEIYNIDDRKREE